MKQITEYINEALGSPIDKVIEWLRNLYQGKPEVPAIRYEYANKFCNFLYMIQPNVAEKTFEIFKRRNSGDNPIVMQFYNKLCQMMYEDYMDTDYFFETITRYVEAKAQKLFASKHINDGDMSQLSEDEYKSIVYRDAFPQYVTYKYTILKNAKSLEDFIFTKFEMGKKDIRDEETIRILLDEITKRCDTLLGQDRNDLVGAPTIKKQQAIYKKLSNTIYTDIKSQYDTVFEQYETFIGGLIAEQDNAEKPTEFDTEVQPEKIRR